MVFLYVVPEIRCRMGAGEAVRVIAVRQKQYLYVHALCQKHVRSSQGRVYAGLIAIIEQHDVVGEAVEHPDLFHAQGCARVGHHVLYATLVHGDDIGIPFHHVDKVFLGDGLLGLVDAVKGLFLVIYLAVGRVDVLLAYALGAAVQNSSAKSDDLSAYAHPWEHGPAIEAVYQLAILPLDAKSCLHQEFFLVSLLQRGRSQRFPLSQREPQLEFLNDVIPETAASEIFHANGFAVGLV